MTARRRATAAMLALLLCAGATAAPEKAAGQAKAKPDKTRPDATQQDAQTPADEAKEVSGMSIVGNSETPKSLTIIPWKSSQLGRDTDFRSSLLGQDLAPLDKPTFLRGIDFYKLSNRNPIQ